MNNAEFFKRLQKELSIKKRGALLVVCNSSESSPGREGFKMAVFRDGSMFGSIGGGVMEYKIVNTLIERLNAAGDFNYLREFIHKNIESEKRSGLICEGSQFVSINSLDEKDLPALHEINRCFSDRRVRVLSLSDHGLEIKDFNDSIKIGFNMLSENDFKYTEPINIKTTIYIVGGGHVGLAVSRQMKILGWRVVLFDERKDISTVTENIFADEIHHSPVEEIGQYIEGGDESFVVIVSHTQHLDLEATIIALDLNVRYVGVMGSGSKIGQLVNSARQKGVAEDKIKKIDAPIGVAINSKTPEEIAVSIAAKIIQIRNMNF
ncbi:MAG TPA: XdhC family protein [Ignavibacteriaceae bacterium]|jgi:xanthine dehydrogenase accessory factor|nr:XdhC family protein [Ignavibacteriaceae bacterium]HOJ19298.1 XdhC family protein [Ignavibacteriaceae bacterium]